MANKKYGDESLGSGNVLGFNQTLQNYLKVSVGNDTYNLTKSDRIKITGTTIFKTPNTGGYLLQQWNINCNDKKNNGKVKIFTKSTKTNSPTADNGANTIPPIGNAFMYIGTSSNNHGNDGVVSCERTDTIQITDITFYYNRLSILTNDSTKSMGRIKIQLL